jgi:hypothetical protein
LHRVRPAQKRFCRVCGFGRITLRRTTGCAMTSAGVWIYRKRSVDSVAKSVAINDVDGKIFID